MGIFYRWQAGEKACDACKKKNGKYFDSPAVERPHPNCRCQLIKCIVWENIPKWEFVKEIKTVDYKPMFAAFVGAIGKAYWRRSYIVKEKCDIKRVRECDFSEVILSKKTDTREVHKTDTVTTRAYKIFQGGDPEVGDRAWTFHPRTGKKVEIPVK
ncbi:hypothetical protein [Maridesulfovibrio sp.]|uniref:hypothetical protein n=1 Tax=Maridesulfovibrio sp. TaxID=2795000 RepID=UPI0029CA22E9|nr:hypothetical protein [Maridesulfovibrio sp.]